jgi:hypothetical protein
MSIAHRMLLPLLAALLALAQPCPAAPAGDGSYIPLQVPSLPRAVHFFRTVLNCAPVDATADASQAALLDCGNGTIVSLARSDASTPATMRAPAIATDDALAAATWLRTNHVRIVGYPARVAKGPGASDVVITFLTPWGQPLRLVSHAAGEPMHAMPMDAQLAAQ